MSERILGRGVELQQVGGLLEDETPVVRALVLTGDAGVGKTTIWEEGIRLARSRGPCSACFKPWRATRRWSWPSTASSGWTRRRNTCSPLPCGGSTAFPRGC